MISLHNKQSFICSIISEAIWYGMPSNPTRLHVLCLINFLKYKLQTYVIKETGDSGKRDKAKCPVCYDHHDIEECQVFLSQTMENRGKTLYKK